MWYFYWLIVLVKVIYLQVYLSSKSQKSLPTLKLFPQRGRRITVSTSSEKENWLSLEVRCISFLGLSRQSTTLGGSNNRILFSHSSGGLEVQDQGVNRVVVFLRPFSSEKMWMAAISFIFLWFTLCTHPCPNSLFL